MKQFYILLILLLYLKPALSSDTTKMLRYTELLSEQMNFPAVMLRANGDFIFSDEEMAMYRVEEIRPNGIKLLKEGGMTSTLYAAHLYAYKGRTFVTAYTMSLGTRGSSILRCFELDESSVESTLKPVQNNLPDIQLSDFGIDKTTSEKIEQYPDLFHFYYEFRDGLLDVNLMYNVPYSEEEKQLIEKILKKDYPNIQDVVQTYGWSTKKGRFLLVE